MPSLLITNDFPPIISGIATYFFQLWKNLPQEQVMVLAPRVSPWHELDRAVNFKIIRKWIPLGESGLSKTVKMFLNVWWGIFCAKRYHVTKLHCGQIVSTGLSGLICKKLFGIPYSVYVCGSESIRFSKHDILRRLMNLILTEAAQVIVNSNSTFNEYSKIVTDISKLKKVTPGVDTIFFKPEKSKFSESFAGKKVLLTVSRLDERKGHDRIIAALPGILTKYPNLMYFIIGTGREEIRLRNLVKIHNITIFVRFIGSISNDELRDYYNVCDLFILPNRITTKHQQLQGDIEGFGIVFLEAAACGKAVIAGNSGGAVEAVEQGVTGILVNPNSTTEIKQAILNLLESPDKANQFGENGRKRVVQLFEWTKLAKLLEPILC